MARVLNASSSDAFKTNRKSGLGFGKDHCEPTCRQEAGNKTSTYQGNHAFRLLIVSVPRLPHNANRWDQFH